MVNTFQLRIKKEHFLQIIRSLSLQFIAIIMWISEFCHKLRKGQLTKLQKVTFLSIVILKIFVGFYVATSYPYYVYVLDKLNLRPFILPNIMCHNCSHFSFKYIINNETVCSQAPFLLIIVISHHANANARQGIRKSWGSVTEYRGVRVKTMFTFGVHEDKNMNYQLKYEQEHYNDILQANFTDNYKTLTQKTLMALGWTTQYCSNARYILKTDDDSFNHPKRFIDYLLTVKQDKFVGGYCFTVMPDRRDGSKYYVPHSLYPDTYYPTYCAGPGYVLSQSATVEILKVAPNVIYLPMEDVYIAGLCRVAAGIQYTEIPGVIISRDQMTKCDLETWAKNTHNIVPGDMQMLWNRAATADKTKDCTWMYTKRVLALLVFLTVWIKLLLWLFRRKNNV